MNPFPAIAAVALAASPIPFCRVVAPTVTRREVARLIANGEDPHLIAAIQAARTDAR